MGDLPNATSRRSQAWSFSPHLLSSIALLATEDHFAELNDKISRGPSELPGDQNTQLQASHPSKGHSSC